MEINRRIDDSINTTSKKTRKKYKIYMLCFKNNNVLALKIW